MNDTKSPGEKTLHVDVKKTLTLKPKTDTNVVRQSFSHGRSKAVLVETKKKRVLKPGEVEPPAAIAPKPVEAAPAPTTAAVAAAPAAAPVPVAAPRVEVRPRAEEQRRPVAQPPQQQQRSSAPQRTGAILQTLSAGERAAREKALAEARIREVEDKKRREEEARLRAIEDERLRIEREAENLRIAAEATARRIAEEERRKAAGDTEPFIETDQTPAEAAAAKAIAAVDRPAVAGPVVARPARDVEEDDDDAPRRGAARPGATPTARKLPVPAVPKPVRPKGDEKPRGKLTVVNAQTEEEENDGRGRSVAAFRRRVQRQQRRMQTFEPREKISREVILPETITIQELSNRMAERGVDVIKLLMKQGQMLKINDTIDADMAQLIAEELGHTVKRVAESDVEEGLFRIGDEDGDLVSRPPVVTIMGHVDHGKTSLLDAIRSTKVAAGEAGGITQHIGAYQVESKGQKITFIDTPGHEAFTAMRSRGAKATDIVILVVAADDGVMPTTVEAINHTRAAGVPIIVAINKIDKPDADPQRVRTALLQHEIVVESMGGDTLEVEVSAKQRLNLDKLLEAVLLQSEVLELKANPTRPAEGTVIEGKLDKGRGPVATVLVQRGTLKVGDILVAGGAWGRVRALLTESGDAVRDAGPSTPVEVLGFQETPEAGDRFAVVENEARAREVADYRLRVKREKAQARGSAARGSLAEMMSQLKESGRKEFVLVVKGDVQGSLEAIVGALEKLGNDEVRARIIHGGVGGITESDVSLASASNAAIIGFNVRASKEAREASEREGVEIRYYNIIYDLVDDVKKAMSGMLTPEIRETMLGNARILEIFAVSKVGKVAGCLITDGTVERGASVRLIRDNVVIHEGKLSQLKRFKDDAKEVPAGQECGMAFENYQDMRAGDVIECYRVEEIARTL
ncbi:translation initiation factor IF-2 [Siculibacillus lacustris]|uniref:Translation initiation factor IF-2 n=1 Tax=Siculibacillus lacustris TaxID=1549641 RepID=A0A4Q9VLW7_9HYPH|nr:translation initiation factor IF-2 [Siculibacillus lacustris]TBW36421.1 translation initiation factor IF-2 [Siculibacillus lacustris]